ncbi:MAG: dicarboxylate/amino acid:cation symporter [Clostridia bacterium]|nr:dicarboxylate/amino acid:cation symporter [Clostridia bacterium]
MKQKTEIYEAGLSAESTDKCSEAVRKYTSALNLSGREASRYALTVEEILLDTQESGDCDRLRLTTGRRFFRSCITLELFGKQQNVFRKNSSGSVLGDSVLKNLGLSPEYSYAEGVNTYLFRIKKKSVNPVISLIIAIASAIVLGIIGKFLLPVGIINGILDNFLTPLHDAFLNMLGCIAGPMIFLSVAWGIYGIGDAATLKKIGKKLLTSYISTVYIVTVLFSLICLPVFKPEFSQNSVSGSELSSILNMILGIIPKNIFSPFTDGNTLQIIFLAVVIGIAMLFLGKKTDAVAKAVEQINYIVQYLIEFVSRLVPYFIFIVILNLIWSDSVSSIASAGKFFITGVICIPVMALFVLLITSVRMKTNPLLLAKKGIPTLVIALTTASSAAAFGTNMNACRKQYGISDTISSFGIPLGIVALKPATAINYISAALFFATFYHVEISVSWLVMMVFSIGILAVATPPIPGGAMTAYTVLFTQLGIPPEAIAITLACDALFDFLDTGIDQFLLPIIMLPQAGKLGMLDRDILKTKSK